MSKKIEIPINHKISEESCIVGSLFVNKEISMSSEGKLIASVKFAGHNLKIQKLDKGD